MRALTELELELVCGGYQTDGQGNPLITVTVVGGGGADGGTHPNGSGGWPEGGGGGGGSPDPDPNSEIIKHADPKLNSGFPNVDMQSLRMVVMLAADYIKEQVRLADLANPTNRTEFSIAIYADADGNLRTGSYLTGQNGSIDYNNRDPHQQGWTMIALVHNHPSGEYRPSVASDFPGNYDSDQEVADYLISQGEAHSNFLHYIIDGDDGTVHEWENQDIRVGNSNNISDDRQQHGLL